MSTKRFLPLFAALTLVVVGCGRSELEEPEDVVGFDAFDVRDGRDVMDVPDAPDGPDVPDVLCRTSIDCDDMLLCNGVEACVSGRCVAGVPVACDDGVSCTADRCDERVRGCLNIADDALCVAPARCDARMGCTTVRCTGDRECDDGNTCNGRETCAGGVCARGTPLFCDDGIDCTIDSCDPMAGCVSRPDDGRCDDSLFCTGVERCDPMLRGCTSTPPPGCEDGDPCTLNACDEMSRSCVTTPLDLDSDGFAPASCGGVDCDDSNPRVNPGAREVCRDGVDNNCDGLADCRDGACARLPMCRCTVTGPEAGRACRDGMDNDCDGQLDCADTDCAGMTGCPPICMPTGAEICGDGTDNDCDGLLDCVDPDCSGVPPCPCVGTPEICTDGRDNDCDRLADCADPDCSGSPSCPCTRPSPENTDFACRDGRDDDCDGLIDCMDPDCATTMACSTRPPNDLCPGAITVGVPSTTRGSTTLARNDFTPITVGFPGCAAGDSADLVYTFTVSATTPLTIDTFGSTYDSVLFVRRDTCATGAQVACNDDAEVGPRRTDARVGMIATPGTYFVFVDGFGASQSGDFVLNISLGVPPEDCNNARDDDGDAAVDCADSDCAMDPRCVCAMPTPENTAFSCRDGSDNDCDGQADCLDPDCARFPACCVPTGPETGRACAGGVDDDCDSLVDCADPDCASSPLCCRPTAENTPAACSDGRDNDCDGRSDCGDPDCAATPVCCVASPENSAMACSDMRDNDCDGQIDCADSSCSGTPACCTPSAENTAASCSDGRDNDCDGQIDCLDANCAAVPACACRPENTPAACADGADNDCDGTVDCRDSDCRAIPGFCPPVCTPTGPENTDAACADMRDNDCDTLLNCADPDCAMTAPCRTGPVNDRCMGAITVGVPSRTVGTTVGAGNDYVPTVTGFPGCQTGDSPDLVYTFTVAATTSLTIDTIGSSYDSVLFVRRDACDMGAQVACNDDTVGTAARVALMATPGTYYVFVDGFASGNAGNFVLNITRGVPPETCDNLRDDDADGLVDCADPDCAMSPTCGCMPSPENTAASCSDGRDNDCDSQIDCMDPECSVFPACCVPSPENDTATCLDGRDNDCDGQTDCMDPGCAAVSACCRVTGAENVTAQCRDGRDNDCDGRIDCMDPGCTTTLACCMPAPENCTDGRDNDCDGVIDCMDPNCFTSPACGCRPTDTIERGVAGCTNGRDDDCDGVIDCMDSDCMPSLMSGGECCNGRDDTGEGVVDEYSCRCDSNADCSMVGTGGPFRSDVCYSSTFSVCGPSCALLGGDGFCSMFFTGAPRCNRMSGECVP